MTRFEGKMTDFLQEAVALHPQGLLTLHKREDAWLNLESELGVVLALMGGPVVNRYKQACYGICPCLPGHTQSKPPSPRSTISPHFPAFVFWNWPNYQPQGLWTYTSLCLEHPSSLSSCSTPLTIQVHLKSPKGHPYSPNLMKFSDVLPRYPPLVAFTTYYER